MHHKYFSGLLLALCGLSLYISFSAISGVKLPLISGSLNLGLDLKGGSSLLLKADFDSFVKDMLEDVTHDVQQALEDAHVGFTSVRLEQYTIFIDMHDSIDKAKLHNILERLDDRFDIEVEGDSKLASVIIKDQYLATVKKHLIVDSMANIRNRIDALGVKEVSAQSEGSNYILLEVPGTENPGEIKSIIGKTAKMTFHLVVSENNMTGGKAIRLRDRDGHPYFIDSVPQLGGEMLQTASSGYSSQTGKPVVHFVFNGAGAKKFAKLTKENVDRALAIVIDGQVVSAPMIREPILGGRGDISGSFTAQDAHELAIMLRSGALPIPLTVVEERTIGPTLGSDSIHSGKYAVLASFICIALFMTLVYSYLGAISSISLLVMISNVICIMFILGSTLTLPGIAGLVLAIGMSVDANVLIFEKIREEIAKYGSARPLNLSRALDIVENGFHKAISAILDSNITTVIAGLTLFFIGDGPLKGFAITLCIGVLSSFLTAVVLSKVLVEWLVSYKFDVLRKI